MPLPECNVCGVEYIESYEGPCQEPRGDYDVILGCWTGYCPGQVSWRATAERLQRELDEVQQRIEKGSECPPQ